MCACLSSYAVLIIIRKMTAAQEEIPMDWAHMDGLSGAMVEMRKTFEGL